MEVKIENQNQDSGTVSVLPEAVVGDGELFSGSTIAPPPAKWLVGAATPCLDGFKKKRGRPRKHGPDGKPSPTLSPMPLSASIPLTGEFPGWKHSQGNPLTSIQRKQKLEFCSPAEQVVYSVGANLMPHVITVGPGEDVNMKIISFAQQGAKAICVLAANGSISNVTLSQQNSSGGTLTYEGRFDILTLSGSYTPNDNGRAKGLSGGMSVSLAGPEGRVLGGGLAGMLVAAGPVQVILGSFLHGHQQEKQKPKKSRFEAESTILPPPIDATALLRETMDRNYGGNEQNISFTLTNTKSLEPENNRSFHASESKVLNTPQFEVSC